MNILGTEIIIYRPSSEKQDDEIEKRYFTPLTDNALKDVLQCGYDYKVKADFARKLERKMNALKLENKRLLARLGLPAEESAF